MLGTFGTINIKAVKRTGKSKKIKNINSGKFRCSGCTRASDIEDELISHIMSDNECKATYYSMPKVMCCSVPTGTTTCIDCPIGETNEVHHS
jgi:hypothetical protein